MIPALKSTLTEIFGSKKALILIATLIATGAARFGWNVDPNSLLPFLGIVGTYLLGQGIADHGKEAALIAANAPAAPKVAQAGFIRPGIIMTIAALCVATFAACSWFKTEAKKAEDAVLDCTKGNMPAVIAIAEPLLERLVELATGADGTVDWNATGVKSLGAKEGMCILTDLFKKEQAAPRKLAPGEVEPSIEELHAAIETHRARAGLASTLKVHTAHGDY